MKKGQGYDRKRELKNNHQEFTKLTLTEKVKGFFVNPVQLFRQYDREPNLRGMLIIIGILAVALYLSKYLLDPHAVDRIISSEVGTDAAQELMNSQTSVLSIILTALGMVLVAYFTVYTAAGIYYILIHAFRGKLSYKRSVCIYSIAFIASVFGDLIITLFNAVTGGMLSFSADPYLGVLLNQLNIFHIWSLVLIYLGIRTMTQLSKKNTILIIIIILAGSTLLKLTTASIAEMLTAL